MTRHQTKYGISVLVSQTSFRGETSGGIARYRLFSQAKCDIGITENASSKMLRKGGEIIMNMNEVQELHL